MEGKTRVIDKSGNVRWVMPHIANNEILMKQMGFKIQHLESKEEVEIKVDLLLNSEESTETKVVFDVVVDPLVFDGMGKELPEEIEGIEGLGEAPEVKTKRGRKSNK
jgi:hypothetical protein